MADQRQLQVLHPFVGRRVGEELLQGAHRIGGVDLFHALAVERAGRVAELVALLGGDVEEAAIRGDAVGQQQATVEQQA